MTTPSGLARKGLAVLGLTLFALTAAKGVELDPKVLAFKTPDQFKWRDPSDQAPNNNTMLYGDATKAGLYAVINKFKPHRFGDPHFHPIDRYVLVVDGAPWRGTGPIVDWNHATRVPKGTYMIEHAGGIHWDGTKDENGAYLIAGIGPNGQTPAPKTDGPWVGGDPSAVTFKTRDQFPWKDNAGNRTAVLAGDPDKPGFYAIMFTWKKGNNFSRPHFHPNDRLIYVLEGTWWVATGNKFDPANLTVPMKPGTFVTHFGKGVHWDGAKDEDAVILIMGEGPATSTPAEAK
jgi:quercetin dioxygenase-like cupin family protein